jgi:hypothetical protein
MPQPDAGLVDQGVVLHFGTPGGVLPRMAESRLDAGTPASGRVAARPDDRRRDDA